MTLKSNVLRGSVALSIAPAILAAAVACSSDDASGTNPITGADAQTDGSSSPPGVDGAIDGVGLPNGYAPIGNGGGQIAELPNGGFVISRVLSSSITVAGTTLAPTPDDAGNSTSSFLMAFNAQFAPQWVSRIQGGYVIDLASDDAGNIYVAAAAYQDYTSGAAEPWGADGHLAPPIAMQDASIIKLDAAGTFIWQFHAGGSQSPDVAVSPDGAHVVVSFGVAPNGVKVAREGGTDDYPSPALKSAVNVFGLDVNGAIVFADVFAGDNAAGALVTMAATGEAIVAIQSAGVQQESRGPDVSREVLAAPGAGSGLGRVKLGPTEAVVQQNARSYRWSAGDVASIAIDSQGRVAACGHFRDTGTLGAQSVTSKGGEDAFVFTLDSTLQTAVQTLTWGGTGDDSCSSVATAQNDALVVGGLFQSADLTVGGLAVANPTAATRGSYVAKIDATGKPLWAQSLDDSAYELRALDLVTSTSGATLVSGEMGATANFGPPLGTIALDGSGSAGYVVELAH